MAEKLKLYLVLICSFFILACNTKTNNSAGKSDLAVIAYYSGNATLIDSFPLEKLTHIIFSFCHLKGNKLSIDNSNDSATIAKLVSLKSRNPELKVLLSLGGWGGCEFCSQVFSSDSARKEFALSTKLLTDQFKTDGIDLDWEYPAISGHPGHQFQESDRPNFTALVKELRNSLGSGATISFAAGGFENFINKSIEWDQVMAIADLVNIMSYDLVHGFSTTTGHHTPLYSSSQQVESADRSVRMLDSIGVPKNKMVIGAAFYGRIWENVDTINNGLYQHGKFKSFTPYRNFSIYVSADNGFIFHHDTTTKSTYAYHPGKKWFATFDDTASIRLKTEYAKKNGLAGIMFWELSLDKQSGGLLDVIDKTKK